MSKNKIKRLCVILGALTILSPAIAAEISLETAPPVVVRTIPTAGSKNVNPGITELRVTYSKPMQDGDWSWSTWGEDNFPETTGKPRYLDDGRTCVLPVKLQPEKFYAIWLNSDKFKNFKDTDGQPAVPYLFTFTTSGSRTNSGAFQDRLVPVRIRTSGTNQTPGTNRTDTQDRLRAIVARSSSASDSAKSADVDERLNEDQRAVLAWTDRQFRNFFDNRTFEGWSDEERAKLETRLIDALNGPRSTEYYQAIGSLAALRSTNALPRLREIAFERVDRNNRDRWMCIRALGIIGDKSAVPELIHLVYHGNQNTHWWAQISLVRLTGQNFGKDWNAWGMWWNESGGQPAYNPEIIRWWDGQAKPDKLAESLEEGDRKFLSDIQPK